MTTTDTDIPRPLLIGIALIQGLLLLLLHQLIDHNLWPDDSPEWLMAFYSLVIIGPTLALLSLRRDNWRKILRWLLPFTLVCGLLGFYTGWQARPVDAIRPGILNVTITLTLGLAAFKALMYIQQRASDQPLSYSLLFTLSWRNFLTWGLALLFTLAVWGILLLWGALFKVINIRFFADLFEELWFIYPVLALSNGFGVIIFRAQSSIIDTIARIQQALMKFLLVFLVFVSMFFLLALPFTGLTPLWETGRGSLMLLWMQGLILFFLNAVYQDDPESRPYILWLHRFIYAGVALLPVYSLIIFYGLFLRISQYGWTLNRCWALLIWGFFAAFSLGYLWGIIRQRDSWLRHLSWINVRMGLCLLGVMLLVNSPLLDFRKIVTRSQIERFDNGEVSLEDLDLYYFRYQLARPGYQALQRIKEEAGEGSDIALQIDSLYYRGSRTGQQPSPEQTVNTLTVSPEHKLPPELTTALVDFFGMESWRRRPGNQHYLLRVDLNMDSTNDYVLFSFSGMTPSTTLFYLYNNQWENATLHTRRDLKPSDIRTALADGSVSTQAPDWRELRVGDAVFRIDNWYRPPVSADSQSN